MCVDMRGTNRGSVIIWVMDVIIIVRKDIYRGNAQKELLIKLRDRNNKHRVKNILLL
jgi:hypothetical protein